MTAQDAYVKYRIPSWLQEHQLRVAAVGSLIARQAPECDEKAVVLCGLFHDMGNILKIDLSPEGNFAMPASDDERSQLRALQKEFAEMYGPDEHAASLAIGRQLGLPQPVLEMMDSMRFSRTAWVLREAPIETKIAKYADLRVSPFGIVSARERLDEARERYKGREFDTGDGYDVELLAATEAMCFGLEELLASSIGFDPAELTDAAAAPVIEGLKKYEIS